MRNEKKTSDNQQVHAPLAGVGVSSPKYIGYATYLNTRVSPIYGGDDIEGLVLMVEKTMNSIPKLGNCSFVIEPNLRLEDPDGFDSYEKYIEQVESY